MVHRRKKRSLEGSPARQDQEDNLDFFFAYPGTEEWGCVQTHFSGEQL